MKRLSIGDTWDDARRVLVTDLPLMLPIAFATFGAAMLLFVSAVPEMVFEEGKLPQLPPGPWMIWLLPCLILQLAGLLWISTLVVRRGLSVAEAGRIALARLPAALGVMLLLVAVQIVLAIPVALSIRMEGGAGPVSSFLNFFSGAITFWLMARLTTVLPLLAESGLGPVEALRLAFHQTEGAAGKLLMLLLFGLFGGMVLVFVFTFLIGAILGIVARLTGAAAITGAIGMALGSGVVAVVILVWAVLVACVHRRLSAA
jgi:hypothetical protein